MLLIVKFKGLFNKKEKEEKHSQSKQVSTRTISSPRVKHASLIALANAAKGADAEQVFPRILMQAAHHKSVTSIRAPIGLGVPAGWFKQLLRRRAKPNKANKVLQIECSKEASISATPSPTSSVANVFVPGSAAIVGCVEDLPNAVGPCAIAALTTPTPLSDANTTGHSNEVVVYTGNAAAATTTTACTTTDPTQADFELIKKLGAGSFGTVFLARHKETNIRVALKAIPKVPRDKLDTDWNREKLEERAARSSNGPETEVLEGSALDEMTALLRSRCQKGILQVLASFHDLGYFYIATELVVGGDLGAEFYRNGPFSVDRVRFYAADLLLGLEALRTNKIVHRDLKPANLLIGRDGHLVIADLGLARSFGEHDADAEQIMARVGPPPERLHELMVGNGKNVTNRGCGTVEYIAPEVFRGEEYAYGVDVWAFGVIMYELLLEKLPWEVFWSAYAHLKVKDEERCREIILNEEAVVTDRDRVHVKLSAQAEQFVLAALDKDQHRRPTPTQLRSHVFFDDFDWERHSSCDAPACWIPGASNAANELSPGDNSDFITATRVLTPDEDCYPQFTFLSPLLSPVPAPSSSLPQLPASELPPSLDVVLPVPQAPHSPSDPGSHMARTDVNSPVSSAMSSTAVGPLTVPSSVVSSMSISSLKCVLTKVKKWARKVWRRLKTHSSGT